MQNVNTSGTKSSGIEALTRNLHSSHKSRAYTVTILYIVVSTIEANPNITLNQLKHLLQQEFFLQPSAVEGILASLISPTMFGCVTRFKRPDEPIDRTHFHIKEERPDVFTDWLKDVTAEFPELLVFEAPKLVKRRK